MAIPKSTIRIAILECDSPVPNVVAHEGTYGDIFKKFLARGAPAGGAADVDVKIVTCSVIQSQEYPDLDEVDALLLTGSKHDSFADESWILSLLEYVRKAHGEGRRMVGICFGHQIICRALGGKVQRNPGGWEVSVCKFDLTEVGQALIGKKEMSLHQMHRDAVLELPACFLNLGFSDRCAIQGSYLPDRVLTVQAHPEFNDYIMSEILKIRHAQGIFADDLYKDASSRSALAHDGDLFSATAWKFLLQLSHNLV